MAATLHDLVSTLCVAAVAIYVLWLLLTSVVDRLTRALWPPAAVAAVARAPPVPPAAADVPAAAGQDEAAPPAPPAEEDTESDAFDAWVATQLAHRWPAGHAMYQQPGVVFARRTAPTLILLAVAVALVLGVPSLGISSSGSGGGNSGAGATGLVGSGDGADAAAVALAGAAAVRDEAVLWASLPELGRVAYVMHPFVTGALPVADCASHAETSAALQRHLGPPAPATLPLGSAAVTTDPDVERAQRDARRALQQSQQRALRRCVLRDETFVPAAALADTQELARDAAWAGRLLRAGKAAAPTTARVRDVLVTRNMTRYYRVYRVVNGDAHPRASLVREDDLLGAVRQWHGAWLRQRRNADLLPCVCATHLGLVQSGMAFLYDKDGGSGGGAWRLLLDVRIVHEVGLGDAVESDVDELYGAYLGTAFPRAVDQPYGVAVLVHAEAVDAAFVDPGVAVTRTRVEEMEPGYLLTTAQAAQPSPFAVVLALRQVAPFTQGKRFEGDHNACLQHCLALDAQWPTAAAPDEA